MTDYIKAIQDKSGIYHREAKNLVSKFIDDATVTDGIVRWNSNDNVPPTDVLNLWQFMGFNFDMDASLVAQKADLQDFLADYRANQPSTPSAEERFEARAALGAGVEVVNFITGRKFTT